MNITYVCLWGLTSLFLGVMAIISNLIPVLGTRRGGPPPREGSECGLYIRQTWMVGSSK